MADLDILFEAPVVPHGKGRPRLAVIGGHARAYTPKDTERWEAAFAAIAAEHAPRVALDEPVRVDVLAVMPRPKRLQRRADPDGLVWCESKPDADNVRKAVLDAMKAWWRDDALVAAGQTVKAFAEKTGAPRVVVRVRTLRETSLASIVVPVFGEVERTGERRESAGRSPLDDLLEQAGVW